MDIRNMIANGYKPMVSPSCTGKRDADGRKIEVYFYKRPSK